MPSDVDVRESPRTVGLRQWGATHHRLRDYLPDVMEAVSGPQGSPMDVRVEVFVGEEESSRLVVSWGSPRAAGLVDLGRKTAALRGSNGANGRFWPLMGPSRAIRVVLTWGAKASSEHRAQAADLAWGAYMAVCSYVEDPADLVRSR